MGIVTDRVRRAGIRSIVLVGALVWCVPSQAKLPWDEYHRLVEKWRTVAPLKSDEVFGDQVDLYSGALSFSATDVSVPGNNALPVSIKRTLAIDDNDEYGVQDSAFADWDIDIPSVSGVFAPDWHANRCSRPAPPTLNSRVNADEYWAGNHANLPGGGEMLVADVQRPKPSTGQYTWLTKGNTYFSCLPTIANGSGEGFLAITEDGTRYWLNHMAQYFEPDYTDVDAYSWPTQFNVFRRKNVLYATRVEDRFGNWVSYTYSNAANQPVRLTQINSSDGRSISLQYNSLGYVASVTQGGRVWSYQYTNRHLSQVTLPDGSRWVLNLAALSDAYVETTAGDGRNCFSFNTITTGDFVGTITHPAGATATFVVNGRRLGRTNVPAFCANWQSDSTDNNNKADDYLILPFRWATLALQSKQVSGVGLPGGLWRYVYTSSSSYFYTNANNEPICRTTTCLDPICTSDSCAGTRTAVITAPDGRWERYTFGNSYRYNEGKLLKREKGASEAQILQTTTYQYNNSTAGQGYSAKIGSSPQTRGVGFIDEYPRPRLSTVLDQDGDRYTTTVDSFDSLIRPLQVTASNSFGHSRTDAVTYYDNPSRWVMGQVESRKNLSPSGLVEESTVYNSNSALPEKFYRFGRLQESRSYYANGTVATVSTPPCTEIGPSDSGCSTITASSWSRGIPQMISYPTLDGQAVSEAAVVDTNGWLSSVTDRRGNTTRYEYDAMGRIRSISYPVGDVQAWKPVISAFEPVYANEYGLASGHWRQTVTMGNQRQETFFDALWRPVLVRDADLGTGQQRFHRRAFDYQGNTTFKAYPATHPNESAGLLTLFDSLDRVIQRRTASPDDTTLETRTYLSQNRVNITDADGKATTVFYRGYGEPASQDAIRIEGALEQVTTVERDVFGKIQSITQSGPWNRGETSQTRSFIYDAYQRPCLRQDPESGSTLWGYDAANRLSWEAKGATATECTSRPSDAAVFRYDAWGRKTYEDYPDAADDVGYRYDFNDNLTAVTNPAAVWTYAYNKRNLLEAEQVQIDGKVLSLDLSYNSLGHVASLLTPGQSITYEPDVWGRPTQLGGYVTQIKYHPDGQIERYALGNGLTYSQTLDGRRRVALQQTVDGGMLVQELRYAYSAANDLMTMRDGVDGADDATLAYDDLHRLTSATGLWGTYEYTYDGLNNLRRRTGGSPMTYVYDRNNRLVSRWGLGNFAQYRYNSRGELTADDNATYTYDGRGQIIGQKRKPKLQLLGSSGGGGSGLFGGLLGGGQGSADERTVGPYVYDGNHHRIRVTPQTGATAEYTLYTRSGRRAYRQIGSQQTDFLELGGQTLVQLTKVGATTTPVYLHPDLLGSPRKATSGTGALLWQEHYDPYGAKLNGSETTVGYTGHAHDATGLTYMKARFYDPSQHRFLTPDPIHFVDDNPFTFNRYAYGNNNPYRFIDPSGEGVETIVDVGYLIHDAGQFIGASAAAGVGAATGNEALTQAGLEGMAETGTDLAGSVAGVATPGASATATRAAAQGIAKLAKAATGPGKVPKSDRDPKRFFTPSEREAKRAEQGHNCANGCGTKIDESNSAGHHQVRHADGGPTTSENHAEVCIECHKDIHKGGDI